MIAANLSIHCRVDRPERIAYIATTIGYGNIIKKKPYRNSEGICVRCLTDTGVIICMTPNESKVITMFIATTHQVVAMYDGKHAPDWIYSRARKNRKYLKAQDIGY